MDAKRLSEIKARLAAATPGPWRQAIDDDAPRDIVATSNPRTSLLCIKENDRNCMAVIYKEADAALIANAPQDLADLIAALEAIDSLLMDRDLTACVADYVDAAELLFGESEWDAGDVGAKLREVLIERDEIHDAAAKLAERWRLASAGLRTIGDGTCGSGRHAVIARDALAAAWGADDAGADEARENASDWLRGAPTQAEADAHADAYPNGGWLIITAAGSRDWPSHRAMDLYLQIDGPAPRRSRPYDGDGNPVCVPRVKSAAGESE